MSARPPSGDVCRRERAEAAERPGLDLDRIAAERVANRHHCHVAHAGAVVGQAREGEQQIGQAIQVGKEQLGDLALARQRDHAPLGPPADGPGQVERGGLRARRRGG